MRITNSEIKSTIVMDVDNNVYCYGNEATVCTLSLDELAEFILKDLFDTKMYEEGCFIKSNENRFDGKEETLERIKKALVPHLKGLAKKGYSFHAL